MVCRQAVAGRADSVCRRAVSAGAIRVPRTCTPPLLLFLLLLLPLRWNYRSMKILRVERLLLLPMRLMKRKFSTVVTVSVAVGIGGRLKNKEAGWLDVN